MTENTDAIIVEKVKKGDKEAYRHLVMRYQQKLFQTCIGFLQNETDAEDLTQEIFIKAYQKIESFRFQAAFSTWLYRISVNTCVNFLRKQKVKRLLFLDSGNQSKESFGVSEPADSATEREEQRRMLRTALKELTLMQRKVFILSQYRELSNKETAEILEITEKAVESLLFRARVKMQKVIKEKMNSNIAPTGRYQQHRAEPYG
ncbi:RNA polymerase sigma factor [Alkalitalea saponilacus]|uniref:RNA polymerase sigma-70 factor, ECF subfamily n=1 Tax=Alkalitalea saponilacus TaxID=889453 RepID=A0A1T5EFH5_9BACT|nr:RNA polymerase sigma factor [Alkalitalea saponilacus]ASB48999.1 RNA polymerase subunit sigma-24 [Alkalitalea saponilacus]SKB82666.1 RNA polymerase sigma-70 factor, ECF subfamily [Alkalitalea saponilacus]